MGYDINWSCTPNDPVKNHPLYQKWSTKALGECAGLRADIITDMNSIRMDCDSTAIMAFMQWLLRSIAVVS